MSVIVQTRIDPEIKEEAAAALKNMGLSLSDAVRLMLVKTAKEKTLPFEIWKPNAETISAIEEAKAGLTEEISIDELRAELDEIG
ncbi:MAG: type II toxin-antitoxin system RelB/DinJ family antitoxin [Synergistaceae bacterium]|nr:type II toxin-antitoxin system RelB/DinJ family antitoxin [Synergistaceae bacterium]